MTGDSLTLQGSKEPLVLESMRVPPAVFSASIEAESAKVQREMEVALRMIEREDPSLRVTHDPETGETVMSGMGELHLEIVSHRLLNDFKLDVRMREPRVAYRETVTAQAANEVHYDRVLSGKRYVASMKLRLRPRERGAGNAVVWTARDPKLSEMLREKLESIRNGALAALGRGPLCGFPMDAVEVQVELDSQEDIERLVAAEPAALGACAAHGTRELMSAAEPRLLEPVMSVDILVPHEYSGAVMSEISSSRRRGRIESISLGNEDDELDAKKQVAPFGDDSVEFNPRSRRVIVATVPLEGLIGYASALRSMTKGTGSFSMSFLTYDFPSLVAEQAIIRSR